jgi:hypothetical protein
MSRPETELYCTLKIKKQQGRVNPQRPRSKLSGHNDGQG